MTATMIASRWRAERLPSNQAIGKIGLETSDEDREPVAVWPTRPYS